VWKLLAGLVIRCASAPHVISPYKAHAATLKNLKKLYFRPDRVATIDRRAFREKR
jgi:hypothetical protein